MQQYVVVDGAAAMGIYFGLKLAILPSEGRSFSLEGEYTLSASIDGQRSLGTAAIRVSNAIHSYATICRVVTSREDKLTVGLTVVT